MELTRCKRCGGRITRRAGAYECIGCGARYAPLSMTDAALLLGSLHDSQPSKSTADAAVPEHLSGDFEIKDGVLVKYKGEGGAVVIPAEVTTIGTAAFPLHSP